MVDGDHYFVDAFPLISVLGLSIYHLKALQNVYYIINPTSFNIKLSCALIKIKHGAALTPIQPQKPSAKLPETFFLSTVLILGTYCYFIEASWWSSFRRGIFNLVTFIFIALYFRALKWLYFLSHRFLHHLSIIFRLWSDKRYLKSSVSPMIGNFARDEES
jgi:hypothetical protein